jgi:hypothetical protein
MHPGNLRAAGAHLIPDVAAQRVRVELALDVAARVRINLAHVDLHRRVVIRRDQTLGPRAGIVEGGRGGGAELSWGLGGGGRGGWGEAARRRTTCAGCTAQRSRPCRKEGKGWGGGGDASAFPREKRVERGGARKGVALGHAQPRKPPAAPPPRRNQSCAKEKATREGGASSNITRAQKNKSNKYSLIVLHFVVERELCTNPTARARAALRAAGVRPPPPPAPAPQPLTCCDTT